MNSSPARGSSQSLSMPSSARSPSRLVTTARQTPNVPTQRLLPPQTNRSQPRRETLLGIEQPTSHVPHPTTMRARPQRLLMRIATWTESDQRRSTAARCCRRGLRDLHGGVSQGEWLRLEARSALCPRLRRSGNAVRWDRMVLAGVAWGSGQSVSLRRH